MSARPARGGGFPDSAAATIDRLVQRFELPHGSAPALSALIELLARDEHAPSAVRDPRSAVNVHLADSLVALEFPEVRGAHAIADVGSGAGFPGLPLAVALPEAHVTLVESNARRASFLQRAADATRLGTVNVANARVEEWTDGFGACDLVVVRALAPLPVVVEYAAPLLEVGGTLVAWRGRRDLEAERMAARAAAEVGMEPVDPRRVVPYAGAEHRYLHLMSKVSETPARFPRRPGVALKRPLGAEGRQSDRTA